MSINVLKNEQCYRYTMDTQSHKKGFISTLAQTLLTWQDRASMRHSLANLDEENLCDMGISPRAAAQESRKPFWWY